MEMQRTRSLLAIAAMLIGVGCTDGSLPETAVEAFEVSPAGAIQPAIPPSATAAPAGSPESGPRPGEQTYDWLVRRGRAELGRSDLAAAAATLQQAQQSAPGRSDAYLWLSLVARAQGNERERCQYLRRYYELHPDTSAKKFYERELQKCK